MGLSLTRRHRPIAKPLSFDSTVIVDTELFRSAELLVFRLFEGGSPNKYLKKGHLHNPTSASDQVGKVTENLPQVPKRPKPVRRVAGLLPFADPGTLAFPMRSRCGTARDKRNCVPSMSSILQSECSHPCQPRLRPISERNRNQRK